jgi:uncharacterized protein (TIGR02646 family)
MRFVNRERIQAKITEEWLKDADATLDSVKDLPAKERREAIKKKSEVWRSLKDILSDASHGKCWYCESREVRSHNPIDHYRPKSAVSECSEHDGYWWLAFDWQNYRFCCTYCNSALRDEDDDEVTHGKQDHFPLLDEAKRAKNSTDNWKLETPLLLDPWEASDTKLLYFDIKGKVIEKYPEGVHKEKFLKAKTSIDTYNLNHSKIKNNRMVIYNRIKELIESSYRKRQVLQNMHDAPPEVTEELNKDLDAIDQSLARLMGEEAEYSSVARCYSMSLRRPDSEWLDELLRIV